MASFIMKHCPFIKDLDFYGSSFKFTLNKKKKYYSSFGGLFSFFGIVFFLCYFGFRLKEFILAEKIKKEFYIISQNNASVVFESFVMVACLITRNNNSNFDNFADSALNHTLSFNEVYTKPWHFQFTRPIEMKTCDISHFPNDLITPPKFEKFKQCKCAPMKQLLLQNYRTEEYYSLLEYNLKFTDEVLDNKTKYDEFKKYFSLHPQRLISYYIETDFNIEDKDHPLFYAFNLIFDNINSESIQRTDIFLKMKRYIEDIYQYSEPKTYKGIIREDTIKTIIPMSDKLKYDPYTKFPLVVNRFYGSNREDVLIKTTEKAMPFLIETFSLFVILTYSFKNFSQFYNNIEKDFYIINRLFKKRGIYKDLITCHSKIEADACACINDKMLDEKIKNENKLIPGNFSFRRQEYNCSNTSEDRKVEIQKTEAELLESVRENRTGNINSERKVEIQKTEAELLENDRENRTGKIKSERILSEKIEECKKEEEGNEKLEKKVIQITQLPDIIKNQPETKNNIVTFHCKYQLI